MSLREGKGRCLAASLLQLSLRTRDGSQSAGVCSRGPNHIYRCPSEYTCRAAASATYSARTGLQASGGAASAPAGVVSCASALGAAPASSTSAATTVSSSDAFLRPRPLDIGAPRVAPIAAKCALGRGGPRACSDEHTPPCLRQQLACLTHSAARAAAGAVRAGAVNVGAGGRILVLHWRKGVAWLARPLRKRVACAVSAASIRPDSVSRGTSRLEAFQPDNFHARRAGVALPRQAACRAAEKIPFHLAMVPRHCCPILRELGGQGGCRQAVQRSVPVRPHIRLW